MRVSIYHLKKKEYFYTPMLLELLCTDVSYWSTFHSRYSDCYFNQWIGSNALFRNGFFPLFSWTTHRCQFNSSAFIFNRLKASHYRLKKTLTQSYEVDMLPQNVLWHVHRMNIYINLIYINYINYSWDSTFTACKKRHQNIEKEQLLTWTILKLCKAW